MKTFTPLIYCFLLAISIPAFSQIDCVATITGSPCFQSIELNCSGTPPLTHVWSNGTYGSTNEGLLPGSHTVTITDFNGNQIVATYVLEGDPDNPCDTLFVNAVAIVDGDQIRVDFVADGFTDVWGAIYTHYYDQNTLEYNGVANFHPLMNNLNADSFYPGASAGSIDYLFMPFTGAETLPAGSVMYSIYFTPLTSGPSEVSIGGDLILITKPSPSGDSSEAMYLVTTPAAINPVPNSTTIQSPKNISIYPNPSNSLMTFEMEEVSGKMVLEVYDAIGRQVLTDIFQNEQLTLSKELVGEGLYFYKLKKDGVSLSGGKFIFY